MGRSRNSSPGLDHGLSLVRAQLAEGSHESGGILVLVAERRPHGASHRKRAKSETVVTDAELLEAWRGGDDDAGSMLVRRHFASVYLFFRDKVQTGAEDLSQRTFLACMEARDAFRGDSSFKAYVFGIARKQLLRHYDERRRHQVHGAKLQPDTGIDSPSLAVAKREEQKLVLRALRELPLDLQIAVELYYWERMSTADIATVLEIPRGTVKTRLHRARELLKTHILDQDEPRDLLQTTIDNLERWARSLREEAGLSTPPAPGTDSE